MNVTEYLKRIGFTEPIAATTGSLRALHRAHMLAVPFENLDIHLGRPIVIDEESFFDKVIHNRRGGFCYELNGLFAALLRTIGFDVTLLSARVIDKNGRPGPEYDHLTLLVKIEDSEPERTWLADVGFGDSFLEPLDLGTTDEQRQCGATYRVTKDGDGCAMERLHNGEWRTQYLFTLQPRPLSEFSEMCVYHQSSPDSPFTRGRVCSRATLDGRITLSDSRLVITSGGERSERPLSEAQFSNVLKEYFDIDIDLNQPTA
jgi:N-hydroxyarylamine O-acetyltransferase